MTALTTDTVDPNVVMFEQMTAAIDAGTVILDRYESPDEELKLTQADAIALANAHFQHAIAVALGEVVDRIEGVELELHNRRVRYSWPRRLWNQLARR